MPLDLRSLWRVLALIGVLIALSAVVGTVVIFIAWVARTF